MSCSEAEGPALLEAHEVTVRFGGLRAVDRVSARFGAGELVTAERAREDLRKSRRGVDMEAGKNQRRLPK